MDQVRRYNPGIPDSITAPSNGAAIEIRVTNSFVPPGPVVGRASVNEDAYVRSGPARSANSISLLPAGLVVTVHEIVDGEQADSRTREWYRIAIYSGEIAYVFAGLCTLQGPPHRAE